MTKHQKRPLMMLVTYGAVISTALLLSACAPTVVASNSRGGTVEHVIGLTKADAFKKADEQCRTYGRVARISEYDVLGSSLAFDCVDP
jgi:hypothetical protein